MKQIEKTIINVELAEAKAVALGNANYGVSQVVELLNNAKTAAEQQFIMDGARALGFGVEFYPVNGEQGVRVTWVN